MREILVTSRNGHDLVAFIDDDDFDRVSKIDWHPVTPRKGYTTYAQGTVNGKSISLHRFVMNAQKGEEVDHQNGYGLDWQKGNLRKIPHSENIRNSKKSAGKTSVYKGVDYYKWGCRKNRWRASIRYPGSKKNTFLGFFATEIEAAEAYNRACIEHGIETARLNFVDVWQPETNTHTPALLIDGEIPMVVRLMGESA